MKNKRSVGFYTIFLSLLVLCFAPISVVLGLSKTKNPFQKDSVNLVKSVNVLIELKEKEENIIYYDNSAEYFALTFPKKSITIVDEKENEQIISINQNELIEDESIFLLDESEEFADKLNQSLFIYSENYNNTNYQLKNDETWETYRYYLEQSIYNVQNNSFNAFVPSNSKISLIDSDDLRILNKKFGYMWLGLVLLVIGLIIGLIFGNYAYLISVLGAVFLFVGYIIHI
jgi:hypothetical protein